MSPKKKKKKDVWEEIKVRNIKINKNKKKNIGQNWEGLSEITQTLRISVYFPTGLRGISWYHVHWAG